eukprot:GHVL01020797.1.p2 GENE.GHVL01020797.1~~GHVL01020797.1.p2  ORF type:complete len:105 (-),score=8.52 GHVL01020797.1:95-409(-)
MLAFAVPRTFFFLPLDSLYPVRPLDTFPSNSPNRLSLYFISNFLHAARFSYIRQNPVLLPPPKAILKPKRMMVLGSVTRNDDDTCAANSFLDTLARPGCTTSKT